MALGQSYDCPHSGDASQIIGVNGQPPTDNITCIMLSLDICIVYLLEIKITTTTQMDLINPLRTDNVTPTKQS